MSIDSVVPRTSLRRSWWRAVVLLPLLTLTFVVGLVFSTQGGAFAFESRPAPTTVPGAVKGPLKILKGRALLLKDVFSAGMWLGRTIVGPAILGNFGPDGGDRTETHMPAPNQGYAFGTSGVIQPPAPGPRQGFSGQFQIRNNTGSSKTMEWWVRCMAPATGVISQNVRTNGPTVIANGAGLLSWGSTSWNCISTVDVIHEVLVISNGVEVWRWVYSPPALATAPWEGTTTTQCLGADGAQVASVVTNWTVTPGPGQPVTFPGADCSVYGDGAKPGNLKVAGGLPGESETILDTDPWTPTAVTQYSLCTTQGTGTGCDLVPQVDGLSCFADGVECGTWANRAGTSCLWGPYLVARQWCQDAYSSFLNQPSTIPTTPTPNPTTPPVEGTVGSGEALNPDGSTTLTQTQTLPDGSKQRVTRTTHPDGSRTITTQPLGPAGEPVGSPQVVNLPAPNTGVPPVTGSNPDPQDGTSCMASAWSWNPIDWVYVPIKCALAWAFVPSTATMAKLQNAGDVTANTVPFSYLADGAGWVQAALTPAPGSCFVLAVPVGPFGDVTMLDTCTPSGVAAILINGDVFGVPYRQLLTVVLYVSLFAPLAWWAWREYAPGSKGLA